MTVEERAREAMEHARAEIEDDAIRFVLDGLNVDSLAELHGLVEDGRFYRQMREDGFRFSEAGASPILMGVPLS